MEAYIKNIKAAVAAIIGLLTGLWGWLGWLVVGWIGCMVLDYLTGSAAAGKAGSGPPPGPERVSGTRPG